MRKHSRIISCVVSFGLILSLWGIPGTIDADAAWTPVEELVITKGTPNTSGYSTATISNYGLLTDNFDHLVPVENSAGKSHYSKIDENGFKFLDEYKSMSGEIFRLISGENADETKSSMLEVTPTNDFNLRRQCTIPSDAAGYFKYDIKFTALPDSNTDFNTTFMLALGYGNASSVGVGYDASTGKAYFCAYKKDNFTSRPSDAVDVEKDRWYTFVYRITNSNGDKTWKIESTVYDAKTGGVVYSASNSNWEALISFSCTGISAQGDVKFHLDNMEFYVGKKEGEAPIITSVSVKNEASEITRNLPLIAYFNESVTGDLKLYKENSEGGFDAVTTTCTSIGVNGKKLIYTGLLDKNTRYKISMENIADSDNNPCVTQEIIFTTENLKEWKPVEIAEVTTTVEEGITSTQIKFTIASPSGYDKFDGAILAAWYSGDEMKGLGSVIKSFTAGSTISETFDFGGVPQAGDTIRIMQFDASVCLIPLASGFIPVQ